VKLTVKQAAERAGVSASLVYGWCKDRRLRHSRPGGLGKRGKILIEDSDLDTFQKKSVVEAGEADDEGPLKHIE
jgi:excisionase family DNA binding protein